MLSWFSKGFVSAVASIAVGAWLPGGAHAATFTVTTTVDSVDAVPGDGVCADAGGACSLRAAVQEANALAGADVILLGAETYLLTRAGNSEQNAVTGDLDIKGSLTITGVDAQRTVIDANGLDRVFEMVNTGSITLTGMTLQNGIAGYNEPSFFVSNAGGAIFHAGGPSTLNLNGVVIRNCSARTGGAIYNVYATLVARNSTLHDNQATAGNGGAIAEGLAAFTRLYNVTISGNSATDSAGALIGANNPPILNNVTITNNIADSDNNGTGNGGGLSTGYSISLTNSILAGNVDRGGEAPDCAGKMTSGGHLLVGNNKGCTVSSASGNRVGTATNPVLAGLQPLAYNGGPTPTHALFNGPAHNGGNPGSPGSGGSTCEATDQRGVDRSASTPCDMGAFEHDQDINLALVVNNDQDINDASPGDGRCETAPMNAVCTLRAAIQESNALIGADTLELPAGTYVLNIPGNNDDRAVTGDLDIVDALTLTGMGETPADTVIDGNALDRLIEVRAGTRQVAIQNLTLTNGNAQVGPVLGGYGGAIMQASGVTTLTDVIMRDNRALYCGAFFNYNTTFGFTGMYLDRVIVRNNVATNYGGGGCNFTLGTMEIKDSTITLNNGNQGGGLFNSFRSYTTITGSTLNGNTANFGGGIFTLWGQGIVTLRNTTVSGNTGRYSGGGVSVSTGDTLNLHNANIVDNVVTDSGGTGGGIHSQGMVNLQNSILANNYASSQTTHECSGTLTSQGHNLVADIDGCTYVGGFGDLTGTTANPLDARLGPLADNGGHSFSHALLPDSPALNAGNPLTPGSGGAACEPVDQRGTDRAVNAPCDIGAVETRLADVAVSLASDADPVQPDAELTYLITGQNLGPDTATAVQLFVTLPAGVSLQSVDAGDWVCDTTLPQLTCTLDALASGVNAELQLAVRAPVASGTHALSAYIGSATQDLVNGNNSAELSITVNAAPSVSGLDKSSYIVGNAPVRLARRVDISDADHALLSSAMVRLETGYQVGEDRLHFTDTTTITGVWDAASGSLTLSGVASLDDYRAALRSVSFDTTGTAPTPGPRGFSVTVSDGTFTGSQSGVDVTVYLLVVASPEPVVPAPTPETPPTPDPGQPEPISPVTPVFAPMTLQALTAPSHAATDAATDTAPQQPAAEAAAAAPADTAQEAAGKEPAKAEPERPADEPAQEGDGTDEPHNSSPPAIAAVLSPGGPGSAIAAPAPAVAVATPAPHTHDYRAGHTVLAEEHQLWQELDAMKLQMQESIDERPLSERIMVGTAQGLTLFAFAGSVNWMLKGSHLLAGLLTSLPLWSQFDPLAVLALTRRERRKRLQERRAQAREDEREFAKLGTMLNQRRQPRGETPE